MAKHDDNPDSTFVKTLKEWDQQILKMANSTASNEFECLDLNLELFHSNYGLFNPLDQ